MNGLRVAIGLTFTECNEFGGLPIDLDGFERYDLRRGADLLSMDSGVVGGMLQSHCSLGNRWDPGAHHVPRHL